MTQKTKGDQAVAWSPAYHMYHDGGLPIRPEGYSDSPPVCVSTFEDVDQHLPRRQITPYIVPKVLEELANDDRSNLVVLALAKLLNNVPVRINALRGDLPVLTLQRCIHHTGIYQILVYSQDETLRNDLTDLYSVLYHEVGRTHLEPGIRPVLIQLLLTHLQYVGMSPVVPPEHCYTDNLRTFMLVTAIGYSLQRAMSEGSMSDNAFRVYPDTLEMVVFMDVPHTDTQSRDISLSHPLSTDTTSVNNAMSQSLRQLLFTMIQQKIITQQQGNDLTAKCTVTLPQISDNLNQRLFLQNKNTVPSTYLDLVVNEYVRKISPYGEATTFLENRRGVLKQQISEPIEGYTQGPSLPHPELICTSHLQGTLKSPFGGVNAPGFPIYSG